MSVKKLRERHSSGAIHQRESSESCPGRHEDVHSPVLRSRIDEHERHSMFDVLFELFLI